jgi:type IV pilus assembly protein PilW
MMTPTLTFNRQRGLSLVELMVAMVIGLLVVLVLTTTMKVFEGHKRTNLSVNDVDQAGNWAAYALDNWIRSAGSGFSSGDGGAYGCTLAAMKGGSQILPRQNALPAPFASVTSGTANKFVLLPLLILPGQTTPSVSGQPSDVLLLMAGTSGYGEVAAAFSAVPDTTSSPPQLNVVSARGFTANDLVLVADVSSTQTGGVCMIEQVASNFAFSTTPAGQASVLPLNSAGTYYGATINSTALTSFVDPINDAVFNLGNVANNNPPIFMVMGVGDNNTLFGYDLLENQNPTSGGAQVPFPLADGVFEMQARYGVDTNGDNKVDTWVAATDSYAPASLTAGNKSAIALIKTIKAVRIGLILRTSLQEKDDVQAATSASVTLFPDLSSSLQYTRSFSGDAKKYRYRTMEMTIPLRNTIMVSSTSSS